MKKDKKAVYNEIWSRQRVRSFLDLVPPPGENPDFYILIRAWRSMRGQDFARFVELFCADGRDLNARGSNGETALELISAHPNSQEYARCLRREIPEIGQSGD